MRVNHLIIGCRNARESVSFYQDLFGFEVISEFVDSGTGAAGFALALTREDSELEFLLVPFGEARLPSPQHIALEVETTEKFEKLLSRANELKLKTRAEPSLKSEKMGVGNLSINGFTYQIFYVLDPGGVNVEVMVRESK